MSELLTTETVPPVDRLDFWREVICAVYVELDAEPVRREQFSGSVSLTRWGETRISRVTSRGQIVTRNPGASEEDCLISLQMRGVGQVTQAGRTAVLEPGDFALYDATRPYQLRFDGDFDQLVIQFPRESLIARNVHIESAVAKTCSGRHGVGAVASSFVQSLADHGAEISDDHRKRLGDQAVDFAATMLAMIAGTDPTEDSVRQFNRQRILDFVDQNLHDPNLSVNLVAGAFGVSTRTVQKLFAADRVQLAARIRDARVAKAKRLLVDPQRSHLTITRIAHELGFGSSAQFARVFRAASGYSPSEYREHAGAI